MTTINFMNEELNVYYTKYQDNGNTALVVENDEGGIFTVTTVNLGVILPKDEAFIKDYSENTGMLKALKDAGLIIEHTGTQQSGFVKLKSYKIDLSLLDYKDY